MSMDPTAFILDNSYAGFVLFQDITFRYLCLAGYTLFHGNKVFSAVKPDTPFSFKFVSMVLTCTGGGILVPIFINGVPVPLAVDAVAIAICFSMFLHTYIPQIRTLLKTNPVFAAGVVFLFEVFRASVVTKLTGAAGKAIPPSDFKIPIFGPIFCGTIGGCGGAFLPMNKGLDPIAKGLAPPMLSAFIAALFYHVFLNTDLSSGVDEAQKKAHVIVATWFIAHGWYQAGLFQMMKTKHESPAEPKKVKSG